MTPSPQSTLTAGGIPSYGTKIQVLDDLSGDFETISGVGDIAGPNRTIAEIETTSHSTGVPVRTFIPSLIDPGDLTFPCFWNPDDPTQSLSSPFGLEHLFQNRKVTQFRLVCTDPGLYTRQFVGFVRNVGESYPVQGVCTRNTTIRISGLMTEVNAVVNLTPANASPTAAGGAATVAVAPDSASDDVAWIASSDAPWLTITSPTGPTIGAGTVNYNVTAQIAAAPERIGHIKIGDKSFTVTQAAGA